MITKDLIKDNITGIPEDQIEPLVELVNNTFNKDLENQNTEIAGIKNLINKVRGTTFGLIDETLKEYGFPKESGKTTEHLGITLKSLKDNSINEDMQGKLKKYNDLEKAYNDLKSKGGDVSQKEKDLLNEIEVLKGTLKEKDDLFESEKTNNKRKLLEYKLKSKMPKVKDDIDDITKELHVSKALEQLIKSADFDDNDKIVFRDNEGNILFNSANKNNPFGVDEMWQNNDYFKPIMHTKQERRGTGLKPEFKSDDKLVLDLSGAKTRVEADTLIERQLLSQGLTKQDDKWVELSTQLRKEYGVEQLPLK